MFVGSTWKREGNKGGGGNVGKCDRWGKGKRANIRGSRGKVEAHLTTEKVIGGDKEGRGKKGSGAKNN